MAAEPITVATAAAPPRHARPFVLVFLLALVVCPLAGVNAWPLSSWQLFSRPRTNRQRGWAAVAGGRAVSTSSLLHGHHGFGPFVTSLSSPAEREATCTRWLREAGARVLRIYRLDWLLSDRQGDRAAPPHRALFLTCGGGASP